MIVFNFSFNKYFGSFTAYSSHYLETMDIVLHHADRLILTPFVYAESWTENDPLRQFCSLIILVNLGAVILYLSCTTISYMIIFDRRLLHHPQRLQVFH